MMPVILASASVRRVALLRSVYPECVVLPQDIDETPLLNEGAVELARRLAQGKARAGFLASENVGAERVVVGCDTVVYFGEVLYGKPGDAEENARFLRELSGRTHHIVTGWCVKTGEVELVRHDITALTFREISEEEIAEFVSVCPRLDCAGGYAVQEEAGKFVEKMEGEVLTVVGFPVEKILETMREAIA